MLRWKHTGFSVYTDSHMELGVFEEKLEADIVEDSDEIKKVRQMLRYVSKPFFSQEKIVMQPDAERILTVGSWHPKGTSSLRSQRTMA